MNANASVPRLLTVPVLLAALSACQSSTWDPAEAEDHRAEVEATVAEIKRIDPDVQRFFDSSVGYAVFPTVGEGGLVLGGAHGKGLVYEKGVVVGSAAITEISFGAQIGGQTFSEIVFFADRKTLDDLKDGDFKTGASVSAIAVEKGAAKSASFHEGIAVFIKPKKGLMAAATIEGQAFNYRPLAAAP
jgi:lipid-binding SYLF domain-containing protein